MLSQPIRTEQRRDAIIKTSAVVFSWDIKQRMNIAENEYIVLYLVLNVYTKTFLDLCYNPVIYI